MAEEYKTTEKSVRDILNILFKYKGKIILFFLIVMSVITIKILFSPDIYESYAKVLVRSFKGTALEKVTGITGQSEINSEIEILKSRGFAEDVIDKISIEKVLFEPEDEENLYEKLINLLKIKSLFSFNNEPEDMTIKRERAILILMGSLSVSAARTTEPTTPSNIINISYQSRTPELAQEILTTIIDGYFDKHFAVYTTASSIEFLSKETDRFKAELHRSEEELKNFKEEFNIISLDEQRTILLTRIGDLETSIDQYVADVRALEASIKSMKKNLSPALTPLKEEQARLEALIARLNISKEQLEEVKDELKILNDNDLMIKQLERKVELKDENYRRYLERLELARIAQSLENEKISIISIIQKPTYLIEPVSMGNIRILALGLFLAIAGGIGIAFLFDYLNHTIKSIDDIEKRLSLHNITAIPSIHTKKVSKILRKEEKRKLKKYSFTPKKMSKNVAVWLYAQKDIRECFENIINHLNISMNRSNKTSYVLAVTSCNRGEGVSTVATGIAYTISLGGDHNVLLVDANFHHPDEDKVIGMDRPPGLYEMSVKRRIQQVKDEDYREHFPSNTKQDYISKIEDTKIIDKLLPSVETLNYKFIVLDLPSIREGGSAIKSASLADGMIFVIEAEKVRREVVNRDKENLVRSGTNIIGAVLNKRKYYIPRWLYKKM